MNATRILVLSDLHLEFAPFQPPDPDLYDVVVLAGDIATGREAVNWPRLQSKFGMKPVVFVPGNHEFYRSERVSRLRELRDEASGTNVHLLDRDKVVIEGIQFLGCTLWTDFELDAPRGVSAAEAMLHGSRALSDFVGSIREREPGCGDQSERVFTPEDSVREHRLSRAWLLEQLQAPSPSGVSATVVVTHHSPSSRSLHPMYAGSHINACFHSELPESFFGAADLWVHGHTHSSADYLHHGTRILANPRGYPRWDGRFENNRFNPNLIVELHFRGATHAD